MEIKRIKLYKGKKIGLPGYSSLDVQFGMEIDLEPYEMDQQPEMIANAWDMIEKQIEKQLEKSGIDPEWLRRGDVERKHN